MAEVTDGLPDDPMAAERRAVRRLMQRYAKPDDRRAWRLFLGDLGLFLGLTALSAAAPMVVQWMLAPVLAILLGRLFLIGHDAGHHSFTSHAGANRLMSFIGFLLSLTPAVTWNFGHAIHHNFANVIGLDTTWPPATPAQYAAMPPWRRALERAWRAPLGQGLYMLWGNVGTNLMVWARADLNRPMRLRAAAGTLAVLAYGAGAVATVWWIDRAAGGGGWGGVVWAWLLPLALWFTLGGIILYLNHTEPDIQWHGTQSRRERPLQVTALDETTVVTLPLGLERWLHNVLDHVPHHLNPRIPCYHLRAAREALEAMLPGRLIHHRLSWRRYLQICRTCQLYDLEGRRWVHFGYRADRRHPA